MLIENLENPSISTGPTRIIKRHKYDVDVHSHYTFATKHQQNQLIKNTLFYFTPKNLIISGHLIRKVQVKIVVDSIPCEGIILTDCSVIYILRLN